MIHWAFALDEVPLGLAVTTALVLPVASIEMLPPLSGEQLADAAASGGPGVVRRQVLAALAARALGVAPQSVRLDARRDQRRILRGTNVFASVAHRAGWVAAALSLTPVGIDLEAVDEAIASGPVALDGFDGDTSKLDDWHGPAGIWAAREAALKAGGRDLTVTVAQWRFGDGTVDYDLVKPLPVDLIDVAGLVAAVASESPAPCNSR